MQAPGRSSCSQEDPIRKEARTTILVAQIFKAEDALVKTPYTGDRLSTLNKPSPVGALAPKTIAHQVQDIYEVDGSVFDPP